MPAQTTRQPLHVVKADLFKALGHPIRVRVLELLVGTERSVSALLVGTTAEPSTLSTHLGVLRRAGVVSTRRVGTTVNYRLADPAVEQFLAAARQFLLITLTRDSRLLADLELEAAQQRGPAGKFSPAGRSDEPTLPIGGPGVTSSAGTT